MWKSWWETYGGRSAGVVAGLFFFFIYLFAGFWDMLFCGFLVAIGYWFGKLRDEKRGPLLPLERVTDWLTSRWPWPR
ncbi:DUF2273 domain-containing protein [Cohnella lubricantis]|uniref:DUF2273 domain-containing protein n=1 Tax=Cohnella lubricantis TaxID=2163172 RepID=A0A841TAH4_9BACL|nr:DUF2273 domain-containing protein [Cohnella lubricantis]MBB6676398.1 DUF2273 domain-containing protein [Cohnella lubricantis]MBP2117595.1 putative membrane protein [Cohnella lubricantis]